MNRRLRTVRWLVLPCLLFVLMQEMNARADLWEGGPASANIGSVSEPLAVVVNRSNPVENLTSSELRNIFLGSRNYWPNGKRITIVMREPGDPSRKTVLHEVCAMSEDQFKNHFLHGLFTGEILVSPKILVSPTGMRKFVFNVPGAIGYLRLEDLDDSVKVIRIDELLPNDKGYKLKIQPQPGN